MNHEQIIRVGIEASMLLEAEVGGDSKKADRHRRELQDLGVQLTWVGEAHYDHDDHRLLSARQLAEHWGILPETVMEWFRKGLMPGFKVGRTRAWFNRQVCEEYLYRNYGGGAVLNFPPVDRKGKPGKKRRVVPKGPQQVYCDGEGI